MPDLSLAFEYQGEQHYIPKYSVYNFASQTTRDAAKRKACVKVKIIGIANFSQAGICLIEVPYWWDGHVDSLATTIHQHRPELFLNTQHLILPFASNNEVT